jgi:hypothetical protein
MPRYYFDLQDGDGMHADLDGGDFRDLTVAEREAVRAIASMAVDTLRSKKQERLTITLRDESGPAIEVAAAFRIRRLRETP